MRYFFSVAAIGLAVLAWGCSQAQPTLAGGKSVRHWLDQLRSPNPKARKKAVTKLGNVGMADRAALPAVLGALQDSDAGVRCEAILALLKSGPAAREAIPTLIDMQQHDRNAQVRSYAAQALEKLQGGQ